MHSPGAMKAMSVTTVGVALVAALLADVRPASAFGGGIHERATGNALPFLASSILGTVVAGNLDEDQGDEADLAARHAQNCRFHDGAGYINMRYEQVVAALRVPLADDPNRAARLFGHILHGVQDFYSHSNWIPLPPQGLGIRGRLLDSGLGMWRVPEPYSILFDDVAFVEGDAPAGVGVRLPMDASGRVSSAVPIVEDRRVPDPRVVVDPARRLAARARIYRGLMTSGAPRYPGDQHCPLVGEPCDVATPLNVCLRHGDSRDSDTSSRNFDGVGRMNLDGDGDGDWFQARHHAKLATEHEWCRLLHLTRDLDSSYVASGRLVGNWGGRDSGDITPHIDGTPCQRGAARRNLVEISAMPAASAPSVLPFVLFRSDFTSSARTSVRPRTTQTLKICANTGEDVVAALVPALAPGVTHVVRSTGTATSRMVRDHRGAFMVTFSIKETPNAC